MRKLIIVISIVFSFGFSSAQTYYPMLDDTLAKWEHEFGWHDGSAPPCVYEFYVTTVFAGDTIIGPYTYKRMYESGYGYSSTCSFSGLTSEYKYVREDNKRIYLYDSGADTLLYDFNLGVGDTIPGYDLSGDVYTITSIDSVLVASTYRKRFNITDTWNTGQYWIIEGIGSSYGPFEPFFVPFEKWSGMICYLSGDTSFYGTAQGCSFLVGINEQPRSTKIKIYPVPAATSFTIESEASLDGSQFRMCDAFGRLIRTVPLQGLLNEIDVSDMPSGIYFYQLFDRQGVIHSGKLIIE